MKKLIPIFSLFIVLLFPIRGKCADFALTAESLQTISYGFESMETATYGGYGFMPLSGEAKQSPYDTFANTNINNLLTNNDITHVYTFDTMDYDTYLATEPWYFSDLNGKTVSREDVRLIEFDNGYYSGRAFVSSDGKLLKRSDIVDSSTLVNLRFGGSVITADDWGLLAVDVSQAVQDVNYSYNYQTQSSAGNLSYYNVTARPGEGGLAGACYSVYISNQYIPGLIVPVNSEANSIINSWYTNDSSLVQYKSLSNVSTNETLSVTPGDFVKNGYHYSYLVRLNANSVPTWFPNMTLLEWFERSSSDYFNYNFGYPDSIYYKVLDGTYVDTFSPTLGKGIRDMDAIYGLDDVVEGVIGNDGISVTPDFDGFNPSLPIGIDNFPYILDWDFPTTITVPIPVGGTIDDAIPDDPAIEQDVPIVIPSEIPDLPIVSGLASRFPFSIPWDIKNMLYGLRGRKVAPSFHISWYIQPLDYTWNFDLDLSAFNAQAEIFRTLVLISFIIGLALFSYRHFFGM